MNCRTAEQFIHRRIDGELSRAERDRLDAHLSECNACRQVSEEYRQLARLAHHWVPQPEAADRPADIFAAQVLARIKDSPRPASTALWMPLLVAAASLACLALIPSALWPTLPNLGGAASALPSWLVSTGRLLPAETLSIWSAAQQIRFSPLWAASLLTGACLLNLLFYTRAVQSRLKGSLS